MNIFCIFLAIIMAIAALHYYLDAGVMKKNEVRLWIAFLYGCLIFYIYQV